MLEQHFYILTNMIIPEKTQLQTDLEKKDTSVLRLAYATCKLAYDLNDYNSKFWSMPNSRLLAALNFDVTASVMTIALNDALLTGLMQAINVLGGQFPKLAGTAFVREDIVFNGTEFVLVAPPEPEPEP